MAGSALITGGTGGLGAAVTHAFLDAGWRVVVPVFDDAERDRVRAHERLVLEPADLSEPASTGAVAALAA
ncbi:MAG: NAD-dependent epimerase/dehydratase family protein, partial [Solirubrobacteraceae bacterium]